MRQGYILIWRRLLEASFYKDSFALHLALHLLLRTNHEPNKILYNNTEIEIKRGQTYAGRFSLSKETGIKPSTVRNKLALLKKIDFLDIKSNNKFSIITILNYNSYQNYKCKIGHQAKQQMDSQRTTNGQQMDTIKECNTLKNEKNDNINAKTLFQDFVLLTKTEHNNLVERFGKEGTEIRIIRLNNYLGSTGKKYRSHYHTILNWENRNCITEKKLKVTKADERIFTAS